MNAHARVFSTATGYVIDAIYESTNRGLYSGKTKEELELEYGFTLESVTAEEAYNRGLAHATTPMRRETKGEFWYSLEVLPPCKYTTARGATSFYVSEAITCNVHSFHVQIGDEYWTANRPSTTTHDELIALVQATQAQETANANQ